MRLLNVDTFKLEDFFYGHVPPYAILSHTWGSDRQEVSYRDVLNGRLGSAATRPPKLTGCCKEAKKDGYQYVWIDTCCIDKTNSVELQEAINSMFRWYRRAAICYAYLSDVPLWSDARGPSFSLSRWFQRGWTLQELLAPLNLRFYDASWTFMGSKGDLCDLVETVTGIPTSFLLGITELHHASVAQRMSWAAKRVTKRQEDLAYCLLGIFGVSMPMIYGEGDKAFRRLQEQIMKDVGDDSILAWGLSKETTLKNAPNVTLGAALAPAPSCFANSGLVVAMDHPAHESFEVHGGSIRLSLTLNTTEDGQVLGCLRCGHERHSNLSVGIPLVAAPEGQPHKYFRVEGHPAVLVQDVTHKDSAPLIHIQLDGGRKSPSQAAGPCWLHIRKSIPDLELIDVHPESCWHKERALIEAAMDPAADGVRRILTRFRSNRSTPTEADFVAVLEVDSQSKPRCDLMVAFRETSLWEIARCPGVCRNRVFGIGGASNGTISLGMTLESLQASSSQRRFVLKPVFLSHAPSVTINMTVAIHLWRATRVLQDLRRVDQSQKDEAAALLYQRREMEQRLAQQQAGLKRVRAEIEALKKEERRLAKELDREKKLQSEFLDAYGRAKQTELGTQEMISNMKRFIETYDTGEQCPEREDVRVRAAEQMLAYAIEKGYLDIAHVFIDQAVTVNEKGPSEKTALHHAVLTNRNVLVRLLIDKGADVNSPDPAGATPLHKAVEKGSEDIVRLLVKNGADVAARTKKGDTPLDLALRAIARSEQIINLLTLHERYRHQQLERERVRRETECYELE